MAKVSKETLRKYSEGMTDKEYQGYMRARQARIDAEAASLMDRLVGGKAAATHVAREACISASTVRRYRKHPLGKRGPLHKTVLKLMIARGER